MNKTLRVLTLLLAVILTAGTAQAKILRFGVKAGLNLNSISVSNKFLEKAMDPSNQCGWNAGVMAEAQVPIIGICADVAVMYSRLNQKIDPIYDDKGQVVADNFGKDFLEIPIHLKYKFNLPMISNYFTPFLFTGPNFAINMNKKTLFEDMKNRKCQTAWDFGIGFELISHLQIEGRYSLGMNNLAKYWDFVDVTDGVKVKNNYWNISVAWLF